MGYLQSWVVGELNRGVKVILLDNLDGDITEKHSPVESLVLLSSILDIIDEIRSRNLSITNPAERCCIIGTVTVCERLPPGITAPYRLGHPLQLHSPELLSRQVLVTSAYNQLWGNAPKDEVSSLVADFQV